MTRRQKQIYDIIRRQLEAGQVAPSLREIAAEVGLTGIAHVQQCLKQLEARGYIRRAPRRARGIELVPRDNEVAQLKGMVNDLTAENARLVSVLKANGIAA